MNCPHCGQAIGGVVFRCSRCRAEVGEAELRSAAGVRTALCRMCRAKKRAQVAATKERVRRESGIEELAPATLRSAAEQNKAE